MSEPAEAVAAGPGLLGKNGDEGSELSVASTYGEVGFGVGRGAQRAGEGLGLSCLETGSVRLLGCLLVCLREH